MSPEKWDIVKALFESAQDLKLKNEPRFNPGLIRYLTKP
jgi:hypothetical protein